MDYTYTILQYNTGAPLFKTVLVAHILKAESIMMFKI